MKKTILGPGTGDIDSDQIEEVPNAYAVATHHPDHVRLHISGTSWTSGGLKTQTWKIYEFFERFLDEFDADMQSLVRNRIQVAEPHLTPENRKTIHEIRGKFFDPPHYPASTFVEVSDLAHEEALVEIEGDAIVPETEWDVDVRMSE